MTGAAAAGASAAAAGAAIAQATKASGAIVRITPSDFSRLVGRASEPLVVHAEGGFFSSVHRYLTSYKGLIFYTQSEAPLQLPGRTEVVEAQRIWIPG